MKGAQAATALAATSPLDGFEAAVRVARNNAPCRIPIVYRGSLELDCRDFNNSGVEQCFVSGSSEPQACKPASAAQQYPALTQVGLHPSWAQVTPLPFITESS